MTPAFDCVVLTQGTRPDELRRGIESLLAQRGVDVRVTVVGNGWDPVGLPPEVRSVHLPTNVGIPAGRNAGIRHTDRELLFALDDDAALPSDDVLGRVAALFDSDPRLGIVQLRVVDPTGLDTPRRQVPRLRVGDPARPSDVTSFWEGAAAFRRQVFADAGYWADQFWYGHEGADLAWRVMDAGYRVHYAGNISCHHPAVAMTRHGFYHYIIARNRVWLARRNLPLPLAVVHVVVWFALNLGRARSPVAVRDILRGYRDGLVQPCGRRKPLRWRTVWRMTLAGRPPVI